MNKRLLNKTLLFMAMEKPSEVLMKDLISQVLAII